MALIKCLLFSLLTARALSTTVLNCDSNTNRCWTVTRCDNDPNATPGVAPSSQLPPPVYDNPAPTSSSSASPPPVVNSVILGVGGTPALPSPTSNAPGSSSNSSTTATASSSSTSSPSSNITPSGKSTKTSSSTTAQRTSVIKRDDIVQGRPDLVPLPRYMPRQIPKPIADIQWCDLATAYFVLINPTYQQANVGANAKTYKTLMGLAIPLAAKSLGPSQNSALPDGSSPILSIQGPSGSRISVYNINGFQLTYYQLSLAINLTDAWMTANTYQSVAVQLTNGNDDIGRLQIL